MQDKLEQIQKLKEKYRNSFSAKKKQIDNHISLIIQSQEDQKTTPEAMLNDVQEFMHKLSGSSGMYDYADIAKLAREAMSLCVFVNGQSVDNNILDVMRQLSNLLELYIKG